MLRGDDKQPPITKATAKTAKPTEKALIKRGVKKAALKKAAKKAPPERAAKKATPKKGKGKK
jgi:hypothetical protein